MYLLFAFLFLLSGSAWCDIYVSPGGNDGGAGTKEQPFASLERARDAVRETIKSGGIPDGGVTVWLDDGDYYFAKTFALSAEDSGADGKPIVYRAAPGARPTFIGGVRISADAFGPVKDEIAKSRIDPGSLDKILRADLKPLCPQPLSSYPDSFEEPPVVPELFFNDERMTLARWPNDDWAEIAEVVDSGPAPWRNVKSDGTGTFKYAGDRPARWVHAPAVWLHGYWCFDWACETIRVKSVDPDTQQIAFIKPHVYGIGGGNPAPRRFHAVNLLEELDRPGEYYIEPSGVLYFMPPGDIANARILLSTLSTPVIDIQGASNITLRGLLIQSCAKSAIEVHGGANVSIAACTVRNTGKDAIVVDGGERHRVVACDIHDIGTAGVKIGGGDRKTLTPCGHEAVNNHIYRVSRRQRTHAYHVHVSGVGVRVANNLIHDGPHQAIGLSGNDHVIEFNEIHHTGLECDDCGSFYMGRNPSERGSVIRYNYWHDVGSSFAHGSCAIYFDDGSGGQTVFGNVFARACGGDFGAVFVHGGHDNVVENNIFIECGKAIGHVPWDDDRWAKFLVEYREKLVTEVDITRAPYVEKYTDLKDYLKPETRPRFNVAGNNIAYKCGKFADGNWKLGDNLFTQDDPGFIDAAGGNYRLRQDAGALKTLPKFKPIPMEKIGLYQDELRSEIK
jgi:hypothetical protein